MSGPPEPPPAGAPPQRADGDALPARSALRPRDAATLVVVETSGSELRVLMGRRRADLVFMPGKFVFPGGRVDAADRQIACSDVLCAVEQQKLLSGMKGPPSTDRARAIALAAIRETFEEAGLLIGVHDADAAETATKARALPCWQPFLAHGVIPKVGSLSLFARAITPPGRPRRYDTRFFMAEVGAIALRVPPPETELQSLDWFTLDEARSLELPSITRAVVEDLADRLSAGIAARHHPVPFYYFRNGSFRRELITV
ncbi:MAG: NUDIX hydrolase [Hyphomicrobium sp.]